MKRWHHRRPAPPVVKAAAAPWWQPEGTSPTSTWFIVNVLLKIFNFACIAYYSLHGMMVILSLPFIYFVLLLDLQIWNYCKIDINLILIIMKVCEWLRCVQASHHNRGSSPSVFHILFPSLRNSFKGKALIPFHNPLQQQHLSDDLQYLMLVTRPKANLMEVLKNKRIGFL